MKRRPEFGPFNEHVDFASSYLALWTLFNSFPKLKRPHLATFRMLTLMYGDAQNIMYEEQGTA